MKKIAEQAVTRPNLYKIITIVTILLLIVIIVCIIQEQFKIRLKKDI